MLQNLANPLLPLADVESLETDEAPLGIAEGYCRHVLVGEPETNFEDLSGLLDM